MKIKIKNDLIFMYLKCILMYTIYIRRIYDLIYICKVKIINNLISLYLKCVNCILIYKIYVCIFMLGKNKK
jgi:hypothetical protein